MDAGKTRNTDLRKRRTLPEDPGGGKMGCSPRGTVPLRAAEHPAAHLLKTATLEQPAASWVSADQTQVRTHQVAAAAVKMAVSFPAARQSKQEVLSLSFLRTEHKLNYDPLAGQKSAVSRPTLRPRVPWERCKPGAACSLRSKLQGNLRSRKESPSVRMHRRKE